MNPRFGGAPSTGLALPEPNLERIRKHSESTPRATSEFLGFVRLEIPKPLKRKHITSPEKFQNCATPSTVGTVSFLEAGHEIVKEYWWHL